MSRNITIAHFADNHFDMTSRWDECLRLHDWAIEDLAARKARGEGPDVILFGGDMYEREPCAEEQNAVEQRLTRFAAIAPVVIIRGNHDPLGYLAIFRRLETVHPIIVEEACGVHVVAGVAVACVSWPRKAEILAALKPESAEEGTALAQEALRGVFLGLGQEMAEHAGPRVLLAHAMAEEGETSLGQPLVGQDMTVCLGDLALADADLVALGHVHKSQRWQRGDMHIIYPGSMKRTEYGETEDKGYVVTRFDHTEGLRPWVVGAIDHVVVPATPMLLVNGVWDDEGMTLDQIVAPAGAEIRLRYTVDSDRRAAARTAAKALETEWRATGAIDVVVDPVVNPVSRARTEARLVAEAPSLREQLETLWTVRQMVLSAERRARLLDKLLLIVGPNAVAQREQVRGAVRFDRIAYRGFRGVDDRAIDLSELQGPLVAFTGPNGSGKTMTLGMLYAALHREVPTRGSLARLALQRNAQLEVDFTTSFGSYTVTHAIDGQTAKPEAVLVDRATGQPVYEDTLVSKLDRWVSERLPRPEVMLAGMFAAQGASGLLGMGGRRDRKAVILRLEGVERFEPWAKTARDKARDAKEAAKVAGARVADERARGMTVKEARVRFEGAEEAVARATGVLERGAAFVARAQAAAEVVKEESRALAEAQGRRARISAGRSTPPGRGSWTSRSASGTTRPSSPTRRSSAWPWSPSARRPPERASSRWRSPRRRPPRAPRGSRRSKRGRRWRARGRGSPRISARGEGDRRARLAGEACGGSRGGEPACAPGRARGGRTRRGDGCRGGRAPPRRDAGERGGPDRRSSGRARDDRRRHGGRGRRRKDHARRRRRARERGGLHAAPSRRCAGGRCGRGMEGEAPPRRRRPGGSKGVPPPRLPRARGGAHPGPGEVRGGRERRHPGRAGRRSRRGEPPPGGRGHAPHGRRA